MNFKKKIIASSLSAMTLGAHGYAMAQNQGVLEEVVVVGIRLSQQNSISLKRDSTSVVDGISAEDIGKLPDVTVADSLQRIPGVQVQRDAGEGSTVNIRGLPQVLTLLNGEQFLTAQNIGEAQPSIADIPSQLMKGLAVYKSADINNKRSGITGTIDLRTWRPTDFDEGLTANVSADYSTGKETESDDYGVNGLINWRNQSVGIMVSGATSDVVLGDNYSGAAANDSLFGSNDWGEFAFDPENPTNQHVTPHGFESFNREVERERTAFNAAFTADLGNGFDLLAEGFYTEMDEFDRAVGLNISNRWQTLDYLTPTAFKETGVVTTEGGNAWHGSPWVSTQEYDVDALWVNSFTVNRTAKSESKHFNIELNYDNDGNWRGKARYIKDSADRTSMNGQSQGDLSNWRDDNRFQLNPFYPADIAALYPEDRLSDIVGDNGGRFIDPNPEGYGENPQLHYDISGSDPRWSGFDTPIKGGLGEGATLRDYMANINSYAIGAFSSEGNTENTADNEIFSLDAGYDFDDPGLGFFTSVDFGARYSKRENEIRKFHLFSPFYAGNGAANPDGCSAQWKAIDVVMNNEQCPAGETIGGEFQGYTVNRPTRIDEFNNVVFVDDYGDITKGLPGVWAADPEDYDNVAAFHRKVFGSADRVSVPGESYDVDLEEISVFLKAGFEIGDFRGDVGFRYVDTEIDVRQNQVGDVLAYGDTNIDIGDFYSTNDYTDFLPSLNLVWEPRDNWAIRFSAAKNMMPLDLGNYGGGLRVDTVSCEDPTIAGGRCVSGADAGGNPDLDPWRSDNYDLSAEYYVGDASMFSLGLFYVDIESFSTTGNTTGQFPDSDGVIRRTVPVVTKVNGEGGEIEGLELAARVAFSDFTDGLFTNFGIDANYTYAPSTSNGKDLTGDDVPFEDNSEDQVNLIGWYQGEKLQVRVAYNYRSERLDTPNIGATGLNIFQDDIFFVDAQVSYMIMEDVFVYLNGSNLTGEVEEYYVDFGRGPDQYWYQNEFEARYTLGFRAKF
ncbi:TonB-dependent receptor [Seongchinamella unica]|uniref:TonB-dependent receptor n=1 Tax=Seongchinamella unica TaxID=2547392 RepID=A0A4R5LVF4_9GAMM|nr:TonB-dependent receptor [Seongchinamella unica]TDG15198.1 TonB-dependent receptor [Seongchinamella unica]